MSYGYYHPDYSDPFLTLEYEEWLESQQPISSNITEPEKSTNENLRLEEQS